MSPTPSTTTKLSLASTSTINQQRTIPGDILHSLENFDIGFLHKKPRKKLQKRLVLKRFHMRHKEPPIPQPGLPKFQWELEEDSPDGFFGSEHKHLLSSGTIRKGAVRTTGLNTEYKRKEAGNQDFFAGITSVFNDSPSALNPAAEIDYDIVYREHNYHVSFSETKVSDAEFEEVKSNGKTGRNGKVSWWKRRKLS